MAQFDLTGKVAIVTGAGRGIGRAIAVGLANAGAKIVITAARNPDEIRRVGADLEHQTGRDCALAVAADVTVEADCRRVVDTALKAFGAVHILINNAGRGMRFVSEEFLEHSTKFWQTDTTTWRTIIDTNVNGPFMMAKAAAPHLLANRWGRIVNISMNKETMRRTGFSPYGPSKAALESETIIWAQDLAGTGVTVNALSPGGITETGMVPAGAIDKFRAVMLDPAIIVPPLLWLCSEGSDAISGRHLVAKDWDPSLPPELAAERAGAAAGW
ncbi:MAG: SDR family oxidoreductase [Candidatus Binataceae bacterium]|nr:SDR family oxidoreductase [Candidatus Binataceae bacterium]